MQLLWLLWVMVSLSRCHWATTWNACCSVHAQHRLSAMHGVTHPVQGSEPLLPHDRAEGAVQVEVLVPINGQARARCLKGVQREGGGHP